ncbi:hypothetical protein HAX54_027280, partial [Datura stramonium]|nr:hypothetical protein [Datura stramonium]
MSDPQILNQNFAEGGHNDSEVLGTNILVLNSSTTSTSRHNIDEDLCRTPTCRENKIPTAGSCPPPAPKKPRKLLLCKRKFPRFEFFEVSGNEELEKFFVSCTEISR